MAEPTTMQDLPDYPRNITFEMVWAALMESRKQNEEKWAKEAERRAEEEKRRAEEKAEEEKRRAEEKAKEEEKWAKEEERRVKEAEERAKKAEEREKERKKEQKEYEKRMKKLDEQMGNVTNRFGELAEHLVAPSIHTRFNELGHFFSETAPGGYRVLDEQGKIKTEIDLLLQNGETVIAVEIKTKPVLKDIDHHIKRLEILRDSRRKKNDNRVIKGAIAGAIFGSIEKKATADAGLYVIVQSGDTMKIEIPEGFVPIEL